MIISQQKTTHLPVKEPPIFSGDPFEYPAFITAFDSIMLMCPWTEIVSSS